MDQGLVTFPGLVPNIGAEMELSRGVRPSSCRLYLPVQPNITRTVGTLRFTYAGNQIDFPHAALAPSTLRVFQDRGRLIWTIQVYDRRWKWRYKRISGQYNARTCDGKIVISTRKNLRELLTLLLDALGGSYSIGSIPDGCYPAVSWKRSRADLQLAHLCEMYGLIPILDVDNVFRIEKLGQGNQLPTSGIIVGDNKYAHAAIPCKVKCVSGATVYQYDLELEPVGMDFDGTVKPIQSLSYKPTNGWEQSWYTTFSEVDVQFRHLAMETVWRWYRVKVPIQVPGLPQIDDLSQLELLDHAAESADDPRKCLAPVVRGQFWDRGDLEHGTELTFSNVRDQAYYTDKFRINADRRIVEFDYPVVRLDQFQGPQPANLWLTTGFKVRDPQGEYYTASAEADVAGAQTSTEIRVDRHKHLWGGKIIKSVLPGGVPYDTTTDITSELQLAATTIAGGYNGSPAEDVTYMGLRSDIHLDGAIAQIRWKCGRGAGATTRVSRNAEFSIFTPDHQQRRRMDRLAQLADDLL